MGDNNFHIKNDRLRRFYENAEEIVRDVNLNMDYPRQVVETLSKIANDKDFPFQEMSDKEIFFFGVLLHKVGNLSFHDRVLESRKKMGKENREHTAEFFCQITDKDSHFIVEKIHTNTPDGSIHPGVPKPFKPSSEDAVRKALLMYTYEKTEQAITDKKELEDYIFDNFISHPPLERKDVQYNDDELHDGAAFAYFYKNL